AGGHEGLGRLCRTPRNGEASSISRSAARPLPLVGDADSSAGTPATAGFTGIRRTARWPVVQCLFWPFWFSCRDSSTQEPGAHTETFVEHARVRGAAPGASSDPDRRFFS